MTRKSAVFKLLDQALTRDAIFKIIQQLEPGDKLYGLNWSYLTSIQREHAYKRSRSVEIHKAHKVIAEPRSSGLVDYS